MTSTTSPFAALRLPQNFGQTLGVKKVLTTVPVGKPPKDRFFRTHQSPDWVYPTFVLEDKVVGETYLVSEEVASVLGSLVRPVELYLVIDRQDNVFLVPVPLPGPNGVRNRWHETLFDAVMLAKSVWLRMSANMHLGGYETFSSGAVLAEPTWPATTLDELLDIAFRGRILTSTDHPVVQAKLGAV
jgi:hypothetical protein